MDKKSRMPQSSAKPNSGDANKKNQDITSGKLFPKSSRRREPPGATNSVKNDQSRKSNVQQKGKNYDKRPKPKGQYHGGSKEDIKVGEDQIAEHGSVLVQGSKKQNLNHLLNFHYEPRDMRGLSNAWTPGRITNKYNRNSNRWLPPVQRHKYNKEQFLQANCQFVVKSSGDYTAYLADPDVLVEWDLIEQIVGRVHSSETLFCPICLSVPVAGKMTRCGHVYCWPCILHYLALSDKPWRKCPICYEAIHKSDLKSVVEVTQKAWNVGDDVSLRLMRRERGSLLAVPVDRSSQTSAPTTFFTLLEDNNDVIYSKLLLADSNNIFDIIECERVQLKLELQEDTDSPENCFVEQALSELLTREQQLCGNVGAISAEAQQEKPCNAEAGAPVNEVDEKVDQVQREIPIEAGSEESELRQDWFDESGEISVAETLDSVPESQVSAAFSKFFYFYQADDGQHIYLHAMNVKMLELQYGSLEKSPPLITGRLLEKEAGSMTEELRRRLRYLHHLPLTCQFEIAEIELKPPIISRGNLAVFSDQLETRKKRRKHHEREERKRERKIMEEENKRMGKYPTPNVHIESRHHFPQWQPEPPSPGVNIPSPPESVATSSTASSPTINSLDINSSDTGPSFAQMLRTTGTRGPSKIDWPRMATSYSTQQRAAPLPSTLEDEDTEGYAPAPSYSQSFGDALAEALEHTGPQSPGVTIGSGKKKKKKGKSTVLFATSMARAS